MCDCVTYFVWQHLFLQWLWVRCQSCGRPPESHNTLVQRKTCVLPDAHFRLLHDLALGSCGSALYLNLLLKMRILEVAPLVVTLPMVIPPSFVKPILVLNLILVWQVHLSWLVLPPCSGISSRSWWHLVCIIIVGLELSLIELWDQLPHTLLEVCSAHKDKVEIKCKDFVGGKTPAEPKLYLLLLYIFLSSFRHIESCYGSRYVHSFLQYGW